MSEEPPTESIEDKPATSTAHTSFSWPGVDVLMESYARYNKERQMEKVLLGEREVNLRQQQECLQQEAQRLRLQMTELYQSKKSLDEERRNQQMTIDNLKKCLRLVR